MAARKADERLVVLASLKIFLANKYTTGYVWDQFCQVLDDGILSQKLMMIRDLMAIK